MIIRWRNKLWQECQPYTMNMYGSARQKFSPWAQNDCRKPDLCQAHAYLKYGKINKHNIICLQIYFRPYLFFWNGTLSIFPRNCSRFGKKISLAVAVGRFLIVTPESTFLNSFLLRSASSFCRKNQRIQMLFCYWAESIRSLSNPIESASLQCYTYIPDKFNHFRTSSL